jgi:AraC-like DNA-binding protein
MSEVRYCVHQPSSALRRHVREILWVHSQRSRVQVLLPETTLTLVLRQSGSASMRNEALPNAIISGLQQRTRFVEHEANSALLIVRFTEVGAPAILHDRVDLLYNRTAPLDSVLPWRDIDHLQNVLTDARDLQQHFMAVERFLIRRIRTQHGTIPQGISPQIEAAAQMIRRSQGRSSIAAIAHHAAMSQSALERHFRVAVGVTPKKLSRLARLQHVCRLWNTGKSLTAISFEAGYCDQSHMVRDFRLFTGTSPEEFFRDARAHNLPIFSN